MKSHLTLLTIPQATLKKVIPSLALMMSSFMTIGALASQAQTVIAINSNSPVVTVEGSSGGNIRDKSCAGFISDVPNYTVEMTEDSDRRFRIQGNSDTTLLVLNSQGKRFCVQADDLSAGEAELPGRWKKGTYRVYIGNKTQMRSNYKLMITPIS
jgi:hypothetical protein